MNNIIFSAAAATNVGCVRRNNEDNLFFDGVRFNAEDNVLSVALTAEKASGNHAFAVFDGMGGESLGEKASELAAFEFSMQFEDMADIRDVRKFDKKLEKFYKAANKAVRKLSAKINATSGTTAAALFLMDEKALVSNVGDSKVFRYSSGMLEQLSEDHTMAALMVRTGAMTPEEASRSRGRNSLTRFVGSAAKDSECTPYNTGWIEVRAGDQFLICSDGLTDMMTEQQIADILAKADMSGSDKVAALVQGALDHGGKDNCTVILVQAS